MDNAKPAAMSWNAGGWFGGQLGATAWIGVAGALTLFHDLASGLIAILLFAIPNTVGLLLWQKRLLSCYTSTQLMIALAGACGLTTVFLLDHAGSWEQIQSGGRVSAYSSYWIIGLTFGGLMLVFYWRFGRRSSSP